MTATAELSVRPHIPAVLVRPAAAIMLLITCAQVSAATKSSSSVKAATQPAGRAGTSSQPALHAAPAPAAGPTTAAAAGWSEDGAAQLASRMSAPWVRMPAGADAPITAGKPSPAPSIVTRPQLPLGDFRKKSYFPFRKSALKESPTMTFELPPLWVEAAPAVPEKLRMPETTRPAPPPVSLPPIRVPYVYSRTYYPPSSAAAPIVTPPVLNESGTTTLPLLKPLPREGSIEQSHPAAGTDELPEPAFPDDDEPERDERVPKWRLNAP